MIINYDTAINNVEKGIENFETLINSDNDGDLIRAQIAMMKYAFRMTAITNILKTEGDARNSVAQNFRY